MEKKGNTPDLPLSSSVENKPLLLDMGKGESVPINPAILIMAEAMRTNCKLCYLAGEVKAELTLNHGLAWLERKLNSRDFVRAHRKYLINIRQIETFNKKLHTVKMKSDCGSFGIPKERWRKVKERFIFIS